MTNFTREYAADLDRDDLMDFRACKNNYIDYIGFMFYVIEKYGLDTGRTFKVDSNGEIYYVVY